MFSRILIATEMSPDALDILRCLKGLRKLGAKECLLVEYLNPHEIKSAIASVFPSVLEENLKKQKKILTDQGYEVETRVVDGFIKTEINRIVIEENFSLIVVGAAEHSMMGEVLLGDIAHEVIQHAIIPVLLIRISENTDEGFTSAKTCDITDHILFPTDFSENADKAFEFVKKMAADGAKKVTLVHVQDMPPMEPHLLNQSEEFNEKYISILEVMKKELQDRGDAEVNTKLLYGFPSAEIIRLVHELNISLVVMGSQGRSFIKEIYLGSVSHNVARHSSASVLLIPAKREG